MGETQELSIPWILLLLTTAQSHEEDTRLADRVIMWYGRGQGGKQGM